MSTVENSNWQWSADAPPQIGYAWVPSDGGEWVAGFSPAFEERDLGVVDASDGALGVAHLRAVGSASPATGWHCHDLEFELFYVLQGTVKVETANGDHYLLGPGATMESTAGCWRNMREISSDFECLQICAPARRDVTSADQPPEAEAPQSAPVFTFDTDEAYVTGAGPRTFFRYRDLGTAASTDGRIHVHVVRANAPGAGTGWHYHTMAQWFLVLGGRGHIRFEDHPDQPLGYLDAMCIGRGPSMRHNVGPIDGDYGVIEICVPSEYDTISVARPEGGAAPPEGGID
jgi:quercetin dioxygenase-like cupin family protein